MLGQLLNTYASLNGRIRSPWLPPNFLHEGTDIPEDIRILERGPANDISAAEPGREVEPRRVAPKRSIHARSLPFAITEKDMARYFLFGYMPYLDTCANYTTQL